MRTFVSMTARRKRALGRELRDKLLGHVRVSQPRHLPSLASVDRILGGVFGEPRDRACDHERSYFSSLPSAHHCLASDQQVASQFPGEFTEA
jgi:hypothetical protein